MNTLTVFAPSGAPASGTVIEQLDPPGNTSGANHLGFFGAGGPKGVPFAIIVGTYQDKTFITNAAGDNLGDVGVLESGQLINHKFITTTTTNPDGFGEQSLLDVPQESGTILIRFVPSGSTPVRTQNALIRTVVLNASSGIDAVDGVVVGLKVQGFEPNVDSSWTQTAGDGALDNRLFIQDHNDNDLVHDYFACYAALPEAVGERNDFGFFVIIEFL